jgi:hypothetical protein
VEWDVGTYSPCPLTVSTMPLFIYSNDRFLYLEIDAESLANVLSCSLVDSMDRGTDPCAKIKSISGRVMLMDCRN